MYKIPRTRITVTCARVFQEERSESDNGRRHTVDFQLRGSIKALRIRPTRLAEISALPLMVREEREAQ